MQRAVFLDRDGVINRVVFREGKGVSPRRLEDFAIFEDAPRAAALLRDAGYRLFVVTNQPDIARGLLDPGDLEEMNRRVRERVHPDEIRVCPHDNHHQCACRKPKPGMLLDLAREEGLDLSRSWLVGDSHKDMDAGRAARVRTVLIRRPDNRETRGDFEAESLLEAAQLIVARTEREESAT